MKKFLRIVLAVFISLIVLAALAALFINLRGIPTYEPESGNLKVEVSPERVARGEKLSNVLCANCHANLETRQLTGRQMKEAGTQFGDIFSQNITADKQFGIGNWTDWELYYLLRTGIKRDGSYAPPYMAKLPHMADEDVYSIIAYLRSNRPEVAAEAVADKPCRPSFLTKLLCTLVFKPMQLPKQVIVIPDTSKVLEFGKYLAINLDCWTCHSADFKTMNMEHPELTPGFFGGGNPLVDLDGKILPSLNLTPDLETGLGKWTEEQFIKAVKYGMVPNQQALRYPMVPYTQLTDTEAQAIFAYLKTVPAISNKIERAAW